MQKISKLFKTIEDIFLMLLFGSMGIVLFAQVFFRYILNMPLTWSEELARYLQVWITFLGIGFGLRHDSHNAMTLVFNKCPKHIQYILGIISNIALIVCLIKLLPAAHSYTEYTQRILSSALRIPKGLVFVSIPIAGYITIGYLISSIIKSFHSLTKPRS